MKGRRNTNLNTLKRVLVILLTNIRSWSKKTFPQSVMERGCASVKTYECVGAEETCENDRLDHMVL